MKKSLLLVLIAIMLLSTLVFVGCKKKVEEQAAEEPQPVEQVQPPVVDTTKTVQ